MEKIWFIWYQTGKVFDLTGLDMIEFGKKIIGSEWTEKFWTVWDKAK